MAEEHNRETQARVHEVRIALALRALRRNGTKPAYDNYVVPAIPDYVDGSFAESAKSKADGAAGRVPAARDAA
ncbi:MAG TPA: hypothetical protein VGG16_14185 [Streptosporangiaceae bacterium]